MTVEPHTPNAIPAIVNPHDYSDKHCSVCFTTRVWELKVAKGGLFIRTYICDSTACVVIAMGLIFEGQAQLKLERI